MNTKNPRSTPAVSVVVPLVGAFALFAGCASDTTSRVVSAPPPPPPASAPTAVVVPANSSTQQVTTTTSVPGTTPQTIIVQQTPPAAQPESPPARPSSRHVWVAGFWAWQDQRYLWVPGQWVVPPRDGANWIPPRWEREGNGYRFYDGFWD